MKPDIPIIQIGMSREELHNEAALVTDEDRAAVAEWLKSRPESVQQAAASVDQFAVYRVKEGVNKSVTGPGTIGSIIGFTESGQIIFGVHVVCHHPDCEAWKVVKTKELDEPFRVYMDADMLELDPIPVVH